MVKCFNIVVSFKQVLEYVDAFLSAFSNVFTDRIYLTKFIIFWLYLVSKTSSHLPLRKSNSLQQSQQTIASEFSEDSLRRGSDESFVVHKGRNIPTLRSLISEDPLIPARLKVILHSTQTPKTLF